jgi:3-oxoacyl-[acyl-carrier protein] reductase
MAGKMKLLDQVAVITGGGRGIGRAIAVAFAREGADAVVTARTTREIEGVAEEVRTLGRRALAVATDVADEQSVAQMVKKALAAFGRIDILVNAAGVIDFGTLSSVSTEMWDRIMGVNLRGAFLTTRAVLPIMREQRRGNVVMVSAVGALGGGGIAPVYRASKAAMNNLAEGFASETLGQGIRVNTICPAETDTRLCATAFPPDVDKSKWMRPEDIADIVLFLASDQSRAMTGATLIACGYTKLSRWG